MAPIVFDLVILLVLALFFGLGWKKGLLLSLCGLAVVAVSFLAAGFLANTFDTPLADAIQPKLAQSIEEQLDAHIGAQLDGQPLSPLDALRDMGGLYTWAADSMEEAAVTMDRIVGGTVREVALHAAKALAVQVAHNVLFAAAFVVLTILLTLLLHALDLVAKLPGLHFCNGLGGGLVGLVKGVLVLWAAVVILQFFPGKLFSEETLEKSYLLPYLIVYNPILALFR